MAETFNCREKNEWGEMKFRRILKSILHYAPAIDGSTG